LRRALERGRALVDFDEEKVERLGDVRVRKTAVEQGLHHRQSRHPARFLRRHHARASAALLHACAHRAQLRFPLFRHRLLRVHAISFVRYWVHMQLIDADYAQVSAHPGLYSLEGGH